MSNCSERSHSFLDETNFNKARLEGWATFFAASSMISQYRSNIDGYFDGVSYWGTLTFLESREINLSDLDGNRYRTEGCYASFLHACWDNIELRSMGYSGDNDDVDIPGSRILEAVTMLEHCSSDCVNPNPDLEEDCIGLLVAALGDGYSESVQAAISGLRTYFFDDPSVFPLSRGPSNLSVLGTDIKRTLTWVDCTSSSAFVYLFGGNDPGDCERTFSIRRNQEVGFKIYCREGNSVFDGTLDGFEEIASVMTDNESWEDERVISEPVSYAVVAFNSTGESIPRTFTQFGDPPKTKITGPLSGYSRNTYTWDAIATDGEGPYSYYWYFAPSCDAEDRVFLGQGPTLTTYLEDSGCFVVEAYGVNNAGGVGTLSVEMTEMDEMVIMSNSSFEFWVGEPEPNPFNPRTTIEFSLPSNGKVDFFVYDLKGRVVHKEVGVEYNRGNNQIEFDGLRLSSGTYYYKISSGINSSTKKMTLVK